MEFTTGGGANRKIFEHPGRAGSPSQRRIGGDSSLEMGQPFSEKIRDGAALFAATAVVHTGASDNAAYQSHILNSIVSTKLWKIQRSQRFSVLQKPFSAAFNFRSIIAHDD